MAPAFNESRWHQLIEEITVGMRDWYKEGIDVSFGTHTWIAPLQDSTIHH